MSSLPHYLTEEILSNLSLEELWKLSGSSEIAEKVMRDMFYESAKEFVEVFGSSWLSEPSKSPFGTADEIDAHIRTKIISDGGEYGELDLFRELEELDYELDLTVPKRYVVPADLQCFWRYCSLELTNLKKGRTFGSEIFSVPEVSVFTTYCSENSRDWDWRKSSLNDWVGFYSSGNSVDNGCGELIMNMNPESEFYGHVHAYSSADEGVASYVASSFTEFMKAAVGRYLPKKDDPEANSLPDLFNY